MFYNLCQHLQGPCQQPPSSLHTLPLPIHHFWHCPNGVQPQMLPPDSLRKANSDYCIHFLSLPPPKEYINICTCMGEGIVLSNPSPPLATMSCVWRCFSRWGRGSCLRRETKALWVHETLIQYSLFLVKLKSLIHWIDVTPLSFLFPSLNTLHSI